MVAEKKFCHQTILCQLRAPPLNQDKKVAEIMLWVWLEIEHQFESQLSEGALEHLHNNNGHYAWQSIEVLAEMLMLRGLCH